MNSEPLELEKIHSLGATSLLDIFRDDSDCFHALTSLVEETDLLARGRNQGNSVSAEDPCRIVTVLSDEAIEEDSSVSTTELVIPAQVGSSEDFSVPNEGKRGSLHGEAVEKLDSTLSVIPEAPRGGGVMSAQNAEGALTTVAFPQSEVRQNAFFFIVSRGGMVTEQPGNKRLRRIVNMYAQLYIEARRVDRGALKHQVFDLCRGQFEFVIQKQAFMRSYERHLQQSGGRHLSPDRIRSILEANGGVQRIMSCEDTDFIRVGDECALDVVGHLLRDAANALRRSEREEKTT